MRKLKVLTHYKLHKAELKTRLFLTKIEAIDVMFFTGMCCITGLWGAIV